MSGSESPENRFLLIVKKILGDMGRKEDESAVKKMVRNGDESARSEAVSNAISCCGALERYKESVLSLDKEIYKLEDISIVIRSCGGEIRISLSDYVNGGKDLDDRCVSCVKMLLLEGEIVSGKASLSAGRAKKPPIVPPQRGASKGASSLALAGGGLSDMMGIVASSLESAALGGPNTPDAVSTMAGGIVSSFFSEGAMASAVERLEGMGDAEIDAVAGLLSISAGIKKDSGKKMVRSILDGLVKEVKGKDNADIDVPSIVGRIVSSVGEDLGPELQSVQQNAELLGSKAEEIMRCVCKRDFPGAHT